MVWKRIRKARGVGRPSGLGLGIFLLASLTSAWAQQGTATPPAPTMTASKGTRTPAGPAGQPEASSDYTVSPEDLVDVYVMDVPEISRTYRVSSNGFLTLPLLSEPIPAAGESLDQLSHLIAAKFHDAGMLNDAYVTVSLIETRLHTVLVTGEVKNPQAYPVFGPTRLLDVLVRAGGLTDTAGDNAVIKRGEAGVRADLEASASTGVANPSTEGQPFAVNIRKLVQSGDDKNNILLYPGDRVTVQHAALVYVLGAVGRPGGYVLGGDNERYTVLKALAMAGDVTGVAKKSRITLLRRDPAGPAEKRDEIPVNYKGMVKGEVADMRLQPDDIIFVPESTKLKAWRASVNSAVQVATYGGSALIIYH